MRVMAMTATANWNASNNWTFAAALSSINYVYSKITETNKATLQSKAAKATGGLASARRYSVSLAKQAPTQRVACFLSFALFEATIGLTKRKRRVFDGPKGSSAHFEKQDKHP
jgi:hypothetical protein